MANQFYQLSSESIACSHCQLQSGKSSNKRIFVRIDTAKKMDGKYSNLEYELVFDH